METSGRRGYKRNQKRHLGGRWFKRALVLLSIVAVLSGLANALLLLSYQQKILPNYLLGRVPVGGIELGKIDERVKEDELLPATMKFTVGSKEQELPLGQLGIAVDWPATRQRLIKARSWFPLFCLVKHRVVLVELKLDKQKFDQAATTLEATFAKAPLPERIIFDGEHFVVVVPRSGYGLNVSQLRLDLVSALGQGKAQLTLPTKTTESSEPVGQLDDELRILNQQLGAQVIFVFAGKSQQLSGAKLGHLYQAAGQTMQPSAEKIQQVISEVAQNLGATPVNSNDAVQAVLYALRRATSVHFVLADKGKRAYRYCTALRGVDSSALAEYQQKLALAYGDPKGWGQGDLTFMHAESGCDFTAWLSAAGSMASFGGVCDSNYSCRQADNVVVNYDRWTNATNPWNAAGGNLENYRTMVINHETGHWLGLGHRNCPGQGQPAPVMQQQSINLQGCRFNPWPTAPEIAAL